MALWESLKSAARGNFSDAGNYLFISQEEVDRGRALDSALEAKARESFERGIYSSQQLDVSLERIRQQSFTEGGIFDQPGTDITAGLAEGAMDGLKNIQSGVKESLRETIKFGSGLIPWQGWLLIGVYLVWRFGLFKFLKK